MARKYDWMYYEVDGKEKRNKIIERFFFTYPDEYQTKCVGFKCEDNVWRYYYPSKAPCYMKIKGKFLPICTAVTPKFYTINDEIELLDELTVFNTNKWHLDNSIKRIELRD